MVIFQGCKDEPIGVGTISKTVKINCPLNFKTLILQMI